MAGRCVFRLAVASGIALALGATAAAGAPNQESGTLESATAGDGLYAVFETSLGTFACALEFEKTPVTVGSFVGLAEGRIQFLDPRTQEWVSRPYYDGLKFHRVAKDFVIQGGDPLGDGTGGPGYAFIDECRPDLRHDRPGILSMANSGPGTNGSQFFITLSKLSYLNDRHTVFGHVVFGIDVIQRIANQPMTGPDQSTPVVDIVLRKLTILRRGAAAERFDPVAAFARQDAIMAEREVQRQAQAQQFRVMLEKEMAQADSLPDGVRYIVRNAGEGAQPNGGEIISVHYAGYLEDGTKFDSSYDRDLPFQFPVSQGYIIKGLDEMFRAMRPGERRRVVVPSEMAYGEHGAKRFGIPPNATLVFDIELLEILRR